MDERISESRSCPDFSFPFFFFPILFLFSSSLSRRGEEGNQTLDRSRELKARRGERAEVLEDGQAFLDPRQKTSSPLGEKEGS